MTNFALLFLHYIVSRAGRRNFDYLDERTVDDRLFSKAVFIYRYGCIVVSASPVTTKRHKLLQHYNSSFLM